MLKGTTYIGLSFGKPGVVERAYRAARTGRFRNMEEIRSELRREGFSRTAIDDHLLSYALRKDLTAICRSQQASL